MEAPGLSVTAISGVEVDDADLVAVASFETFHEANRDRIATALAYTCGSTVLGAEAADEAMARAYLRWNKVAALSNPAGWVYRTGLNWSRTQIHRRRREELFDSVADGTSPDENVDVDLVAAVAGLPVRHRSIVVLRHLLGYSTAETAQALGVSEGTVKSRLARALDRLRTELEKSHG
jgi:RNA polymerase sigma factor (sigma-70 family)